jgi:hypothetical protein
MKTSLRPAATQSPQRRPRPRISDRPYTKTRPSGQHSRRQFLRLAVGAAALPAVSRIAMAQRVRKAECGTSLAIEGGQGDGHDRALCIS